MPATQCCSGASVAGADAGHHDRGSGRARGVGVVAFINRRRAPSCGRVAAADGTQPGGLAKFRILGPTSTCTIDTFRYMYHIDSMATFCSAASCGTRRAVREIGQHSAIPYSYVGIAAVPQCSARFVSWQYLRIPPSRHRCPKGQIKIFE